MSLHSLGAWAVVVHGHPPLLCPGTGWVLCWAPGPAAGSLGLTTAPLPVPLCCWGQGGGEIRSEVEFGKKGGVEQRCFSGVVLLLSDLIGNKIKVFPQVLAMTVIAE